MYMKQVLIIDAPPLFREFLKDKLKNENIQVEIAQTDRDASIKLISNLPDLVIIDIADDFAPLTEFLARKQDDPNAKRIPIIITGPRIDNDKISVLAQSGVIKYFTKPIKFDLFFESIGQVLHSRFTLDTTPCVLDLHLNHNIIFVEVSEGLNREKLSLLKYKLTEIIDANKMEHPKFILMITNLSLSFVDGANLEMLFDNIIADKRLEKKNIKVLSMDPFVADFVSGHVDYNGIEVVNSLASILNGLLDTSYSESVPELISDRILAADENANVGSVETKFYSDSGIVEKPHTQTDGLRIAVIDGDATVRKLLSAVFSGIRAQCDVYDSGTEFLQAVNRRPYDLIILDIFMTGISGYNILKTLHTSKNRPPVIIYSKSMQRQVVEQALGLGAKAFLIKPQRPEVIIKKSLEIINASKQS